MCENKEPKILENNHKIDSGFGDLVIMEVDGTWSTIGILSHKALDLDKQQTIKDAYVTAPWFIALPWQQPAVPRPRTIVVRNVFPCTCIDL